MKIAKKETYACEGRRKSKYRGGGGKRNGAGGAEAPSITRAEKLKLCEYIHMYKFLKMRLN